MLFQRRDDDVPIFLLKPIREIRRILDDKTDEIKRGASPAPQATSVLMDKRSRSASPNVGRPDTKKQPTAKVPEIKESAKEVDELNKTGGKVQDSVTISPPPAIEVHNEKEEKVTVEIESIPINVVTIEDSKPNVIEELAVLVPSPPAKQKDQPQEQQSVDVEVVSADVLSGSDDVPKIREIPETQGNSDLISASSSILEIIEEVLVVEKIADVNNNTSKIEKTNDNLEPV